MFDGKEAANRRVTRCRQPQAAACAACEREASESKEPASLTNRALQAAAFLYANSFPVPLADERDVEQTIKGAQIHDTIQEERCLVPIRKIVKHLSCHRIKGSHTKGSQCDTKRVP